jgi:hypothetical protein
VRDLFKLILFVSRNDNVGNRRWQHLRYRRWPDQRAQSRRQSQKPAADNRRGTLIRRAELRHERSNTGGAKRPATLLHGALHFSQQRELDARQAVQEIRKRPSRNGIRPSRTGMRLNRTGTRLNLTGTRLNLTGTRLNRTGIRLNRTGIRLNLSDIRPSRTGTRRRRNGTRRARGMPNGDAKLGGQAARPPQGFGKRAPVDELQLPGGLGGALAPKKPLFRGRQQARRIRGAFQNGVSLNLPSQPRIDRKNIGSGPDATLTSQLGSGIREPGRMRPLA